MPDFAELMNILSRPRPNGSPALLQTGRALQDWLKRRRIPFQVQSFRIYPYFQETFGLYLIVTSSLLATAVLLRWGWPAFGIALASLLGGLAGLVWGIPLVSWPGAGNGENLLLEFSAPAPRQEVVLCAHYDSKTELLDHRQRMVLLKFLPFGLVLTLLLGLLGPLDQSLLAHRAVLASLARLGGIVASAVLLSWAWGLGLNLGLGRMRPPSQGAVDNGAACAILLGLAADLQRHAQEGRQPFHQTRITIALFSGEEVNMQGSQAYVRRREWPLPVVALNLEAMAQNGSYVLWEREGTLLDMKPVPPELNQAVAAVVQAETGQEPAAGGPMLSDSGSFARRGIPATTLGTYDLELKNRGLHQPSDNLDRVVISRLSEGVEILKVVIDRFDREGLPV